MKYILLLILLCWNVLCHAAFDDLFLNRTLRIDYIHSGNAKEEYFSLDEILVEPTWDRNKEIMINPFDFGKYKFQAYDTLSGELIFQTSYSTLFGEWQTTDEAKVLSRSFEETVIMPYPKSVVRLEFYSRNAKNVWIKKFSFIVKPNDMMISKEVVYQCKTRQLQFTGDPSHKLDIAFIAEGYTKGQMGKFRSDARRFMNYILECEPYNSHKEDINFWAIESHSDENGADNPGLNIWKQTILNSHYWTFLSERYLTTYENKILRHIASNAPYDKIIVLVNSDKYGGSGFYNFYSMCSTDDPLSKFVVTHELGHDLAGLGDEYYSGETAMQNFYSTEVEPWEPNLTTLKQFNLKWKDLVKSTTPVPTTSGPKYDREIGAFEGAGYAEKGMYRPMEDCSMKSTTYNNFCPVCKRAINKMIEYYTH